MSERNIKIKVIRACFGGYGKQLLCKRVKGCWENDYEKKNRVKSRNCGVFKYGEVEKGKLKLK